ncbi:MAG: SoxR reducing system RseC family protein [Clostridia bacterium]|jgi:sigma-E factor negative regulatory protein RseC|nr:SoxR reducing system RseC family protein [Clostridia bacterium]MDD4276111.1 SoxR reducing system RseC family protein [Clostridia bacterium]
MIEQAVVLNVNGDIANLAVTRKSACGQCNACGFSGKREQAIFETKNYVNASAGQIVEIEIINKYFALMIILSYVVPLILFGLGLHLGTLLGSELIQFLCGILFFMLAFIPLKLLDKKLAPTVTIKSIIK